MIDQFQKTQGNSYLQLQPKQIKFSGYQLGKNLTSIIKIVNKSPVSQRINIFPPTQPGFTIKANKKGYIAAGMSENINVFFVSDVFKYQYDVVKINSEIGNFIVPIYAYPTIPKLYDIFPKIIDFGAVSVNQSSSFVYPISNPIPIDFPYQFTYKLQSSAFIITPLTGKILSQSTQNIQIAFIPSDNKTFTAQIQFKIQQFDFQPIKIKLLGNGKSKKQNLSNSKKIKSLKLYPIKKNQQKSIQQQKQLPTQTLKKPLQNSLTNQKKSQIKSKLLNPKLPKKTDPISTKTMVSNPQTFYQEYKKQYQKQFNSQFSKIFQLDKQKQIKFAQYLGDHPITTQQLQNHNNTLLSTLNIKQQNLNHIYTTRYLTSKSMTCEVDLTRFIKKQPTWDFNKNDLLKLRKQKLKMFMNAGTIIIKQYRLKKRLAQIKKFIQSCKTKQDVQQKIQADYLLSMDLGKTKFKKKFQKFSFHLEQLISTTFPLQYKDKAQSIKKTFTTQGSTNFDSFKPLDQVSSNQVQIMNYSFINFPTNFIHMQKIIPPTRQSAQQQYPLKTAALPQYQLIQPSTIYKLPLKVPSHQFIYNSFQFNRYKTYNPIDQKDPQYLINSTLQQIQDQFQGWSKGQMDVLKAKFQRNMGCQFSSISRYTYPTYGDLGFMGQLGLNLPKSIQNSQIQQDDVIEQGDSDEQKLTAIQLQPIQPLLTKIQQKSKTKQRRQKKYLQNYQSSLLSIIDKNLQTIKFKNISYAIDKISSYNKWIIKHDNKIFI